MEIGQIVLLVIVVVILTYFVSWLFSKSKQLTNMAKAKDQQTVLADTLPVKDNTGNYTYSMWIYINDWNYRYGQEKIILTRQDANAKANPKVALGANENTLTVSIAVYPPAATGTGTGAASGNVEMVDCMIQNIPLQRWTNIITSVYGRTLDIYLDGKLVRTCVLKGVPKITSTADIIVTPGGGFDGYTTNFQYFPMASNPQEAYNIYKEGLGGSILGNLINKFRIRVSFVKDNVVQSSFEI